jgi:hypothetical protein
LRDWAEREAERRRGMRRPTAAGAGSTPAVPAARLGAARSRTLPAPTRGRSARRRWRRVATAALLSTLLAAAWLVARSTA